MRRTGWPLALIVLLMAAPAWSEQIMHFKNGTSMPIQSFELTDGQYRVDLGGDAFMAFPESLVEKVVLPDGQVARSTATAAPDSTGPMIAASGSTGGSAQGGRGSARVGGAAVPGSSEPKVYTKPADTDRFGNVTDRPFTTGGANKQALRMTGNERARQMRSASSTRTDSQGRRVIPGDGKTQKLVTGVKKK